MLKTAALFFEKKNIYIYCHILIYAAYQMDSISSSFTVPHVLPVWRKYIFGKILRTTS